MKKWAALLLSLILCLCLVTVGVSAAEAHGYTVQVQVLGEGAVIPGGTISVVEGGSVTLRFMPEEGYEVTGVYVDGFPAGLALELYQHCQDCEGCAACGWINWSMAYAGMDDDDWNDWRDLVTLENVCKDHLVYVVFARQELPAEPEKTPEKPVFSDLKADGWYAEAVDYVLEKKLMDGVGGGLFAPEENLTRAQLVTMLWRLEGQPAVKYDLKVTDVAEGLWYTEAVRWAEAEQIVTGSNGRFAPQDPITREQLAAILWRYAKYKEMDVSVGENTNILSYNDAFTVSEYAYPALQWTCGAGILNGADGNLMPQGHATRAQAAAMLYRFLTLE